MARASFDDKEKIQRRLTKMAADIRGVGLDDLVLEQIRSDVDCADDAEFLLAVTNWMSKFCPAFLALTAVLAEAKLRCTPETYVALEEASHVGAFPNAFVRDPSVIGGIA